MLRSTLALVVALAVLLPGSAAYAHTSLVGTDPEDGDVLTELEQVTLEFSGAVLDLGTTLALVKDDERIELEPEFPAENTVTAQVPALTDGEWSLVFRVVAEDGHPLEGQVDFAFVEVAVTTAEPTAEPSASASSTPRAEATVASSASPTPIAAAVTSASAEPTASATPVEAEGDRTGGWARLIGVAVLIAVATAVIVWVRRRGDDAVAGGAESPGSGDAELETDADTDGGPAEPGVR